MTTSGSSAPAPGAAHIARMLLEASRSGPPLVACTVIAAPPGSAVAPGAKVLLRADGTTVGGLAGGPLEAAVLADARAALARHLTETVSYSSQGHRLDGRRAVQAAAEVVEVLLEVVEPPATLLVVGAGHVGRAVGEVGALLGLSVALLDDREDYADPERLPFADRVICGDFAHELDHFPIGPSTYVVLVSRGHKVDELALRHVVGRGAAYVGMIGRARRTRTVLEHLRADGLDPAALDRVHTPIGLDIGAETPAEIAVAILAEITLVRHGGTGVSLSPAGRRAAHPLE